MHRPAREIGQKWIVRVSEEGWGYTRRLTAAVEGVGLRILVTRASHGCNHRGGCYTFFRPRGYSLTVVFYSTIVYDEPLMHGIVDLFCFTIQNLEHLFT